MNASPLLFRVAVTNSRPPTPVVRRVSFKVAIYEKPKNYGGALEKKRYKRGLLQKDVAERMGVSYFTYLWWERDRYLPQDRQWKLVIEFLGYYPILEMISDINQFRARRRHLGISKKALAKHLNIDENTYARIERGVPACGRMCSHAEIVSKIKLL